jgi:hypothetical protein
LEDIRQIIKIAKEKSIDLRLFFSPEHAWILRAAYVVGLFPKLEQWKSKISTLAVSNNIILIDFQKLNKYTTEEVPSFDDSSFQMKWWWDGSHYKQSYGERIIERIINYPYQKDDLSQFISDPSEVSESMSEMLKKLKIYEASHSNDMRDMKSIEKNARTVSISGQ